MATPDNPFDLMTMKPTNVPYEELSSVSEDSHLVLPTSSGTTGREHDVYGGTGVDVRCLLIASMFPPIHGGSAVVYDNLCRSMPLGSMRVLTAKRNYIDNTPVPGWQAHDTQASYPIDRIDFLRPRILPPPANTLISVYRLLFQDIPVYSRALLAAARIVKMHDINVVCVGELGTGSWLAMTLRKLFGVKVIMYVHGEEITTASGGRFSGNKRQQYLQCADKIVAVSAFTREALTGLMHIKLESITLIQNGVDTTRFAPGPRSEELLVKHGLASKKIVVTVGRLVARKGIDKAVLAFKRVLRDCPNTHYLIIGDGQLRPELERLIASEGLSQDITLAGQVSDADLISYLRLCDVFLMPNRTLENGDTEGFGLVFREANACGKPVIGGRAGGVVEAVIHNESGLLVDGNDVNDIAAAIKSILEDDALAERLGKGGLQLARANNTESVARRFLDTCKSVLGSVDRRLQGKKPSSTG